MMNWSEYEEEQPKRKTISPYWAVVLAVLLGIGLASALWAGKVYSAPMFTAATEGAIITLTDEPCTLEAVTNLKYRATWVEKEKTFEGCWAPHRELGVVIAYFDDKTVAIIPVQAFVKVVGA
jgi:hypothetical protein